MKWSSIDQGRLSCAPSMRAKKFFGQHFLRDVSVVQAIVDALDAGAQDNVLEIGPGEGVLTKELVQDAKRLIAVDIDPEAIQTTRAAVPSPKLELIERNVLEYSVSDVDRLFDGEPWLLVGNLPYNITSDLLTWMLSDASGPKRMVVMVQKEVADRMMAGAGKMNMLALFVQLYAGVRKVVTVPPGSFAPPPKVHSAVVRLDRDGAGAYQELGVKDPETFLRFAKVAFANKRKQLKTTLGTLPQVDAGRLQHILEELGYTKTVRPEELSFEDWVHLYHKVHGYC